MENIVKGKGGTATVSMTFRMPVDRGVVRSASASFSGMLELNFYCEMPDEILADKQAYVEMSVNGKKISKVLVKDAKNKTLSGRKTKFFSYQLVAKQMRDEVLFKLYNGKGEAVALRSGSGVDYGTNGCPMSIKGYCDLVIKNSTDEKMLALANAMIDYGTASQINFKYNADGLAVSSRVSNFNKQYVVDNFTHSVTGDKPAGFAGYQSLSLVLESATNLRVYHGYDDGIGSGRFAYTLDDASVKMIKTSSGKCYLETAGIAAKDLDTVHTFTISLGGKTQTLKASALSYAALLCKGDNEVQNNLGKALYLYNVAAKEYFKK